MKIRLVRFTDEGRFELSRRRVLTLSDPIAYQQAKRSEIGDQFQNKLLFIFLRRLFFCLDSGCPPRQMKMAAMNLNLSRTQKSAAGEIPVPYRQLSQPLPFVIPEYNFPAGGVAIALGDAGAMPSRPSSKISAPSAIKIPEPRVQSPNNPGQPSLSHAIRVKTAEYWLKLGDADQALKELERLPRTTWTQPWVVRIRVAAVGTLRQRDEVLA